MRQFEQLPAGRRWNEMPSVPPEQLHTVEPLQDLHLDRGGLGNAKLLRRASHAPVADNGLEGPDLRVLHTALHT
jgi:hypothetical protein